MLGRADHSKETGGPSDMHPLVSIRIPLYNHQDYIIDALESVLKDTYPNKELVIIDDGSTDHSLHVAQNWIDNTKPDFPVSLTTQENKGVTRTLNSLVQKSKGAFLVSLASDDRLQSGGIQKRITYLQENPQKSAVIGDCNVISAKGELISTSGLSKFYHANLDMYKTDSGLLEEIITNWSVPGSVMMVRREVYDKVGPYNETLTVEDWDFYLRLASQGLLGFINTPVSDYRLHGKNTALAKDKKFQNYSQMALTAWHNLSTVPKSHRLGLIKKLISLTSRALYFGLVQILSLKKT